MLIFLWWRDVMLTLKIEDTGCSAMLLELLALYNVEESASCSWFKYINVIVWDQNIFSGKWYLFTLQLELFRLIPVYILKMDAMYKRLLCWGLITNGFLCKKKTYVLFIFLNTFKLFCCYIQSYFYLPFTSSVNPELSWPWLG